ncbi:uridine diphosphate glucose pyrophosphatase NUDT14 isoform X1 [Sturnira hondurensis]|uniref:uridine diphosphate glucose pyrophosphatase NUDT14 isoform X1 n=1 Tax=Sturnira hondurensis TaxID=192404 RepID=UPI00187AE65A|nr:uridine diphosphate glucose pyrophosphatase NUDT14 isoform X1 [Sturnira hondurensis]
MPPYSQGPMGLVWGTLLSPHPTTTTSPSPLPGLPWHLLPPAWCPAGDSGGGLLGPSPACSQPGFLGVGGSPAHTSAARCRGQGDTPKWGRRALHEHGQEGLRSRRPPRLTSFSRCGLQVPWAGSLGPSFRVSAAGSTVHPGAQVPFPGPRAVALAVTVFWLALSRDHGQLLRALQCLPWGPSQRAACCIFKANRSGVGLTGSSQTMFYAEVTDTQRGGPGGGLAEEGELIEVVHLPLAGAQAFSDNPDVPKTLGVIFGISWFFSCVAPGLDPQ